MEEGPIDYVKILKAGGGKKNISKKKKGEENIYDWDFAGSQNGTGRGTESPS